MLKTLHIYRSQVLLLHKKHIYCKFWIYIYLWTHTYTFWSLNYEPKPHPRPKPILTCTITLAHNLNLNLAQNQSLTPNPLFYQSLLLLWFGISWPRRLARFCHATWNSTVKDNMLALSFVICKTSILGQLCCNLIIVSMNFGIFVDRDQSWMIIMLCLKYKKFHSQKMLDYILDMSRLLRGHMYNILLWILHLRHNARHWGSTIF